MFIEQCLVIALAPSEPRNLRGSDGARTLFIKSTINTEPLQGCQTLTFQASLFTTTAIIRKADDEGLAVLFSVMVRPIYVDKANLAASPASNSF